MENLLAQVPELKLTKKVETRTTHAKDISEAVFLKTTVGKVGEVITFEIWHDANGVKWTRSDVLHYMKISNLLDNVKNPVEMDLEVAH